MKLAVMTRSTALFRLICQCFEPDGAQCTRFSDEVVFARAIYRDDYTAILIDAETGMNPMRPVLARRSCYADRRAPLVVVGAHENRESIIELFDAGADDIVLCPINSSELVLRVHLAVRRFQPLQAADTTDRLECGSYLLDRRTCTVWVDDEPVRLTSREFAIAWLVFACPGEYVSRRQIAGAVWSSSEDIVGRTLEQHIYKLRKKLSLNGSHGVRLRTMYAHGYRVEVDLPKDLRQARVAAEESAEAADRVQADDMLSTIASLVQVDAMSPTPADGFALHGASRAELHPADSETARSARAWSGSDCADILAVCTPAGPSHAFGGTAGETAHGRNGH
jgi:DNA-binding response OmpR family regulator